jgi:uncharacterized membrane protein YcaP (DUF421 family)
MDILTIFLRTILIYFVVFSIMRIMGKREIGKLSVFDLVISIMIAEIAVVVLEDADKPLIEGLVPMATLVVIQILIAYITLKNQKIRLWFDGKPSIIIDKGKLDRTEMRKQRYSLDDLLLQLRENKITKVSDVEFAILETTGKLTVIEKSGNKQADTPDAHSDSTIISGASIQENHAKIRYEGLPLSLIMDGKVQDDNLQKIGKTRFWLKNEIQAKGVYDFKDIFFCSIDHNGKIFIDKK